MSERPQIVTELCPPTNFVAGYVRNNRQADLVRSVVIVDTLSEGNPLAEQWLGAIANLSISAVLDCEVPFVRKAVEEVDAQFEAGLATTLAKDAHAALSEHARQSSSGPEQTADTYLRLWDVIKRGDPALHGLKRHTKDKGHVAQDKMPRDAYINTVQNLGYALLWNDTRRLDPINDRLSRGLEPPRSCFRDVVLDVSTKTGVVAFDEAFSLLRGITLQGFQSGGGVAIVAGVWRYWSPKQQDELFFPADYVRERPHNPVLDRKYSKSDWLELWINTTQQLEVAQAEADRR